MLRVTQLVRDGPESEPRASDPHLTPFPDPPQPQTFPEKPRVPQATSCQEATQWVHEQLVSSCFFLPGRWRPSAAPLEAQPQEEANPWVAGTSYIWRKPPALGHWRGAAGDSGSVSRCPQFPFHLTHSSSKNTDEKDCGPLKPLHVK